MLAEFSRYPSHIQELLKPLADLRFDYSQQSDGETRNLLSGLNPQDLFDEEIKNEVLARCCVSGLWLLHGYLDQSHEISQTIHQPEGSFWHAIMHRAEGDFWNSKYWYRKTGAHAVLANMKQVADSVVGEALVDLCENATQQRKLAQHANNMAKAEWLLLFDHCWNHAVSS